MEWKRVFVIFGVILSCVGCFYPEPEGEYQTDFENETLPDEPTVASLPPVPSSGSSLCLQPGEDLSFADWIGRGDGLLVGTISAIEPALDIGWSRTPIEGGEPADQLRDASECAVIRDGFKITLTNLSGYLHDSSVPDSIDLYFGYLTVNGFTRPPSTTLENGIQWIGGQPWLTVGMQIGGLVYRNDFVDRWSFGPSVRRPIFVVTDDGISFQPAERDACDDWPPVEELSGRTVSELQHKIAELSADELFSPPEERRWTIAWRAGREYGYAGDYAARCSTVEELHAADTSVATAECDTDSDCAHDQFCNGSSKCEAH